MAYSPTNLPLSAAGQALGLGHMLAAQTADQTDELRRKRMQQVQGGGFTDPTGAGTRATMAAPGGSWFGLGLGGLR
jgi:hypothetical protein